MVIYSLERRRLASFYITTCYVVLPRGTTRRDRTYWLRKTCFSDEYESSKCIAYRAHVLLTNGSSKDQRLLSLFLLAVALSRTFSTCRIKYSAFRMEEKEGL